MAMMINRGMGCGLIIPPTSPKLGFDHFGPILIFNSAGCYLGVLPGEFVWKVKCAVYVGSGWFLASTTNQQRFRFIRTSNQDTRAPSTDCKWPFGLEKLELAAPNKNLEFSRTKPRHTAALRTTNLIKSLSLNNREEIHWMRPKSKPYSRLMELMLAASQ